MKDYDKNKESYIFNIGMLIIYTVGQQFPVNSFEQIEDISQFNKDFIKTYYKESDKGYFLNADIHYLENLHNLHNDLPFLSERMNIEKVEKLVTTLHDKVEYVIHIRNLKQALNHGLVLKNCTQLLNLNNRKTMENVRTHKDIKLFTTEIEETVWCQNQIIILPSFPQKICWLQK